MKKKITALAFAVCVICLTACSVQEEKPTKEEEREVSETSVDFRGTTFTKEEQVYLMRTIEEKGKEAYIDCMPIIEEEVLTSICRKYEELAVVGLKVVD